MSDAKDRALVAGKRETGKPRSCLTLLIPGHHENLTSITLVRLS